MQGKGLGKKESRENDLEQAEGWSRHKRIAWGFTKREPKGRKKRAREEGRKALSLRRQKTWSTQRRTNSFSIKTPREAVSRLRTKSSTPRCTVQKGRLGETTGWGTDVKVPSKLIKKQRKGEPAALKNTCSTRGGRNRGRGQGPSGGPEEMEGRRVGKNKTEWYVKLKKDNGRRTLRVV